MTTTTVIDWVAGDALALRIPVHAGALRDGGADFLTAAFQASGALAADQRVAGITRFEDCPGGSTGRKLLLSVAYEPDIPGLPTELFVKFSRDFDDAIRDRAKNQLEPEVRLARLSRRPGFPIAVPACLFADYHRKSGSGLLITQRIAFGSGGIEPLHDKCRDYDLPEPLAHYRALIKALARLAGTHQAGRLSADVASEFAFDAEQAIASDRIRYSEQQLLNRVARYAEFAERYPQLLPAQIRTPEFLSQLGCDIPRFLQQEQPIRRLLHSRPEFIALCHWNANIDNAWFWRGADGELECGLMDWGRVGQMSVALALFGALSAAEIGLWDAHLYELLTLFADEFHGCGGAALDVEALKTHLLLWVALMGLAWLLDAPALIQAQIADLSAIESRRDPRFGANETARVQLHMLSTVLHLWQTEDFSRLLDRVLAAP
ncbi:hypothetical protein [Hydrocarboniphaga sp.]|uniref:hypothetical protein n=1 Tax=Hydrocarboniphaga sp. TaxID=2033016 RepID=UPI003D0C2D39